ncbi:DNA-binding response regulator, NarL/FixJ family, contains REC and HTH domains [Aquimarina amphilecti]|uniref:DNA-binding response regulator, NarL/FixJ family, contains REC and HTH domains n=1 Tax=Aquimarina amphilecti TaxID=1038014 RepID=A0A1H7WRB9_AQUAM|nr:response regulator [Aquimarina amphilecti]SEM24120.1 DNA-binding response regulator, NarL/FixJ family, contains REC and HTH domains [Aquimarina amphilecti]
MKKKLKVLMIDDHPMIIEGYKNTLLGENQKEYQIKIDIASNCDDAYDNILKSSKTTPYDMLFVDIKLPPSSDGTITSGEDLAKHAKELLPKAKIIILTMHREDHRIHNILKNINPSGFLIKSDLTSSELLLAFNNIVSGTPYYSATVNNHFRKMMTNNFSLDEKNLKILYHLSRGVKTKNLPNYVSLSLSAIEKRKNQIKEMFSIAKADDQKLLEEARKRGFV